MDSDPVNEERAERRAERAVEALGPGGLNELFSTNVVKNVYNFDKNRWTDTINDEKKNSVCSGIIKTLTGSGYDPLEYANILYQAGKASGDNIKRNQAVLIIRCYYRNIETDEHEDCSVTDMIAALDAMGLSDNNRMMDDRVDDIMFGDGPGAASYGGGAIHQSGGALADDLATLLFLKRNLIYKLVKVGPEYAGRLVGWIDGQLAKLAKLKRCVLDILGINPDTFYHDITNYIGGLYNQGAIAFDSALYSASDNAKSVREWIMANKVHAFGLTAFVLRYQNNIVDAGRDVVSVLPAIFNALAVTGSTFLTVIEYFWQSDTGVALLLSLYYYDQNAELVNAAAVKAFKAGTDNVITGSKNVMAAIEQFETHVNGIVDDYAKVKLNDNLIQMMSALKKTLTDDATANANAEHLTKLAEILNKTTEAQFQLFETVNKAVMTRSQTARIDAAKATLDSVKTQLDEANQALIAAMNDASKGGKSRSRKSHKKVSKSKRPKRSARSRKAKGAKRSHKK